MKNSCANLGKRKFLYEQLFNQTSTAHILSLLFSHTNERNKLVHSRYLLADLSVAAELRGRSP